MLRPSMATSGLLKPPSLAGTAVVERNGATSRLDLKSNQTARRNLKTARPGQRNSSQCKRLAMSDEKALGGEGKLDSQRRFARLISAGVSDRKVFAKTQSV